MGTAPHPASTLSLGVELQVGSHRRHREGDQASFSAGLRHLVSGWWPRRTLTSPSPFIQTEGKGLRDQTLTNSILACTSVRSCGDLSGQLKRRPLPAPPT